MSINVNIKMQQKIRIILSNCDKIIGTVLPKKIGYILFCVFAELCFIC